MTTWHEADDLPTVPEVEILYWDGRYMCRISGTYDHEAGAWYVGGEPLLEDGWEVRYWAYPRLMPSDNPSDER